MVGNQGAKGRANYTMMGDNVNLAARMEAGAKNWGVWVLCTEATRRGCENAEPGRIFFRPLGKIIVKGRADLLELFEPIALRENVTDQQRECVATFEAGLAKWRERDWPGAIEVFERSARLEPQQIDPAAGIVSNPSTVFLGMAREMRGNPGAAPVVF
jgi:adenylate cyclase